MRFDAGRIRKGELIAASGGIVLLAALFFLPWFGAPEPAGALASNRGSLDGWQALTTMRWILLVTIAVSIALFVLSATQRAPAIPTTLSMLTCVLGGLSSLLLLYRVIEHSGHSAQAGFYLGVVAALAVAYGGYLSLRTEASSFSDPRSIETIRTRTPSPGLAGRDRVDLDRTARAVESVSDDRSE